MFEELDPLVWNSHGESVIKADATNISGDTKKRHSRYIFGDGDNVWEERMQNVVSLLRSYFISVRNRLHHVDTHQHEVHYAFLVDTITKIFVVTA